MVINTFLHILLMNKLIHTYILVILYIVMTNSFSTYADYVHSYDINYLQRWTLVLLYMYFIRSQLDVIGQWNPKLCMVIRTFMYILLMKQLFQTYILVILYIVMTNSFSIYVDCVYSYDNNYL
jgi:hypothetical protein